MKSVGGQAARDAIHRGDCACRAGHRHVAAARYWERKATGSWLTPIGFARTQCGLTRKDLRPRGTKIHVVDNYPSVSLLPIAAAKVQGKDLQADIPLIARGLDLPVDQVQATLKRYGSSPKYESILLKQDITQDEQAFIEAHRNELPELETFDEQRRLYPCGMVFAAHLVSATLARSPNPGPEHDEVRLYEPGDVVGKSGVLKRPMTRFCGARMSPATLSSTATVRWSASSSQQLAIPGQDLRLTIDLDIQRVAEQAMEGKTTARWSRWTPIRARFLPWSRVHVRSQPVRGAP